MFVAAPPVSSGRKSARVPAHPPTAKPSRQASMAERKERPVSLELRYQMIAEAAYFRAEKRGFGIGDTARDWLEAEIEIDRILRQPSDPDAASPETAKQAFQQKLEAQLQEWDVRLDALRAKVREVKAERRADFEKQLEMLFGKRTAAQFKLQELRSRSEDVWDELKVGAEKTWDEMRKALDQIADRFK